MSKQATTVADTAAQATRAAKAAFAQVTEEQLRRFLEAQPDIVNPEVSEFHAVTDGAGASNGIALFRLRREVGGHPVEEDLVLRYSPGQQLLQQKSYADEFATMQALVRRGLPVPEPRWLDPDGSALGCPGYAMTRIGGRSPEAAMFQSGLLADASPQERRSMLLEAAGFHGRLRAAAIGPADVPHLVDRGTGTTAIEREVNWWLTEARLAVPGGSPKLEYLEALGRWMCDNQPSMRPATLVHGDAQIANIMFRDGAIAGVVDWELSYLGHSEADLALILFLAQSHGASVPDMAGLPTADEYIARYEKEAGAQVEHLEYFSVLNFIKILAIYLMLGDRLPDLDSVWSFNVALADEMRAVAAGAVS